MIKFKNVLGGIKISVPKTSLFEGCEGGFFGKTKFYYDDDNYYLGTDYESAETFEFSNPDDFMNL